MYKSILYVEDGSVDVDQFKQDLGDDVYVVVYRQGSTPPKLVQPEQPLESVIDSVRVELSNKLEKAQTVLEEVFEMKMSKKLLKKLNDLYTDLFY